MSVRVMAWVWAESKAEPTDRLVLLAIADCANDAGADAYPSMAALTKKTGLHERSVQRSLARLVAIGELVVQPNAGPRGCNRYRLPLTPGAVPPRQSATPADDHPAERHPPGTVPPNPRQSATPTPGTPPPEPSVTHQRTTREPSRKGTRLPDDFAITPSMRKWALANVPQLANSRETEKFRNHWAAASGRTAVKVDWAAAWRNWMLRAAEFAATRASPSTAPPRLADAERCPEHHDQPAENCRHCLVRSKARPREDP